MNFMKEKEIRQFGTVVALVDDDVDVVVVVVDSAPTISQHTCIRALEMCRATLWVVM